MCRANDAPIFITKNGYGDLVIMSMNHYEELLAGLDICAQLDAAETGYRRRGQQHHGFCRKG